MRCHQVAQVVRQPAIDARKLDKQRDLDVWPLLENVGLEVAPTSGLVVTGVIRGRAAARAGIQVGDTLACAGGRRLFEQTDLRGVLHRGPRGAGQIEIWWLREDHVHHATLELPAGWRKTRLEWRPSIVRGNVGADCGIDWLERLDARERERRKLPADGMALRPRWFEDRAPTYVQAAGLSSTQVILAVNDERADVDGQTFQFGFRMRFDPGDPVRLKVRSDKGEEQVLTFRARHKSR
jgi:S1-C subfamily serine protease